MIDLTKKIKLLDLITNIQEVEVESAIDSLEMLVKIDYGWLAIGKRLNQYIMIDVNLIKEDSWRLLVDIITYRKQRL